MRTGVKINISAIVLVLLFLALFAVFFYLVNLINKRTVTVVLGEKVFIESEIADSQLEKSLGLSGRESLDEGGGMLFIIGKNSRPTFWMRDMSFDIDIIWILDNEIIGIEYNIDHSVQNKFYYPPRPINYVLEIKGGTALRHGLETGDRVRIITKPFGEFLRGLIK